jgi:transcriptional regulator with XRE-family HTH domain
MPKQKRPATEFGARLIALRQARGLTQIQLAAAAHSTQRAISYYETGGGYPTPQALITLAKILDVTTDELLGVRAAKRAPDVTPKTRSLWKQFQKVAELPERDQRAVIRLINSLSSARDHAA